MEPPSDVKATTIVAETRERHTENDVSAAMTTRSIKQRGCLLLDRSHSSPSEHRLSRRSADPSWRERFEVPRTNECDLASNALGSARNPTRYDALTGGRRRQREPTMSDPVSEERHKHASSFWSIVLIFVVVMLGIAGYSYYINMHHGTTTSGRATGESPRPAPGNQP
jgi:hypothetical protein